MVKTETVNITLPIEGTEVSIDITITDREYSMIDSDDTFRDYQLTCLQPEDDEDHWFELSWSLEREDKSHTCIENNWELELTCPNCGKKITTGFDGKEFEHLPDFCTDCSSVNLIRDQPTEQGQSHIINYTIQFH